MFAVSHTSSRLGQHAVPYFRHACVVIGVRRLAWTPPCRAWTACRASRTSLSGSAASGRTSRLSGSWVRCFTHDSRQTAYSPAPDLRALTEAGVKEFSRIAMLEGVESVEPLAMSTWPEQQEASQWLYLHLASLANGLLPPAYLERLLRLELKPKRVEGVSDYWYVLHALMQCPGLLSALAETDFILDILKEMLSFEALKSVSDVQFSQALLLFSTCGDSHGRKRMLVHHFFNDIGTRLDTTTDPGAFVGLVAFCCFLGGKTGKTGHADEYNKTFLNKVYFSLTRLMTRRSVAMGDISVCSGLAEATHGLQFRHDGFLEEFALLIQLTAPATERDCWAPRYVSPILFMFAWLGHAVPDLAAMWHHCFSSLTDHSTRFRTTNARSLLRLMWAFVAHDLEPPHWLLVRYALSLQLSDGWRGFVDESDIELLAQCMPALQGVADQLPDGFPATESAVRASTHRLPWAVQLSGGGGGDATGVRLADGMAFAAAEPSTGRLRPWPSSVRVDRMAPALARSLPFVPVQLLMHDAGNFVLDGRANGLVVRRRQQLEAAGWTVVVVPVHKPVTPDIADTCRTAIRLALVGGGKEQAERPM